MWIWPSLTIFKDHIGYTKHYVGIVSSLTDALVWFRNISLVYLGVWWIWNCAHCKTNGSSFASSHSLLDVSPGANSNMCQLSGICSRVQKILIHLSIVITIHNMHFFFQLSSTMLACVALHSRSLLYFQLLQLKAQQQKIYFTLVCPYGLLCSLRN